jgi:hypothetical protein
MTRRQLLALLPAAWAAADAPASFELVDMHVHLNRLSLPIIYGLQTSRWRVLSICVSRATGQDPSDFEAQLRGTSELHCESHGCVAWAGSFDARTWPEADFSTRTVAALQSSFVTEPLRSRSGRTSACRSASRTAGI